MPLGNLTFTWYLLKYDWSVRTLSPWVFPLLSSHQLFVTCVYLCTLDSIPIMLVLYAHFIWKCCRSLSPIFSPTWLTDATCLQTVNSQRNKTFPVVFLALLGSAKARTTQNKLSQHTRTQTSTCSTNLERVLIFHRFQLEKSSEQTHQGGYSVAAPVTEPGGWILPTSNRARQINPIS